MKQRYFLIKDNQEFDNTLEQYVEWKSLIVCNCDVLAVNHPAREYLQEFIDDCTELTEEEGAELLAALYSNKNLKAEFYYKEGYLYIEYEFDIHLANCQ